MNREQRLFLASVGESGSVAKLLTQIEGRLLPHSRRRVQEYEWTSSILRRSLEDHDETIYLRTKRIGKRRGNSLLTLILLIALIGAATLEWKSYTVPVVVEWLGEVAHRCGFE